MEQRTELCHKALLCRHKRLEGTLSDVAPLLWQYGAFARLEKGEKIDKLLHNGYSSISLGYAGLYECVKYMTGKSHIDSQEGHDFGIKVMLYDIILFSVPLNSKTFHNLLQMTMLYLQGLM